MATVKTEEEIRLLREGGKRLARVLDQVSRAALPGVSPASLDRLAERLIRERGDTPSFLGYRGRREKKAFPATLCVSVNDAVVHGVPANTPLREGDVVGLDCGLVHGGLFVDGAVTVGAGALDPAARTLIEVTRAALAAGIRAARAGNTVGDIGHAVESFVRPHGLGIIRELAGHGVGHAVHEEPFIPNFGIKGTGAPLLSGMVLAIEPMLTEGNPGVIVDGDGFTYRTKDGTRAAHFEHTVLVRDGDAEILTLP